MSSHQVGKYMAACGFADYEHLFKEWICLYGTGGGKKTSNNTPVVFGGVKCPLCLGDECV